MKVGDLVEHQNAGTGIGIIVCTDSTKYNGDYRVYFSSHGKIKFYHYSYMRVINEAG